MLECVGSVGAVAVAAAVGVGVVAGRWLHFGSIGSSGGQIDAMAEWSGSTALDIGMRSCFECGALFRFAFAFAATGDVGADVLGWPLAIGNARRLQPLLRPPFPVGN